MFKTNQKVKQLTELEKLNEILDTFLVNGCQVGKLEDFSVRVVIMTPALAKNILEIRNVSNRKVTPTNVRLIGKAMVEDKWDFNGDSIRFDENGNMIDGQHRLLAIINTGVSVPMVIMTGIKKDAFDTIDIGTKRSASDIFSINKIKNEVLTASVVKFIYAFKNGKYSANRNTVRNLQNHEIMDYYNSLPNIEESISFASKLKTKGQKLLAPSVLGGMHYLLSEVDPEMATEFMQQLYVGSNLSENSPIIPLRNRLIKTKIDKNFTITNTVLLQSIIFVWDKVMAGKTCKTLKVPEDYPIEIKKLA